MLHNLKQRKLGGEKGFTIIEVMIVLAIAGLILLIVFLAVPALQRNSRNTQRKNDVAAVLAGVSEFQNNNSGVFPQGGTWTNTGGTVTFVGANGTSPTEARVGYYNAGVAAAGGNVFKAAAGTATAAATFDTAAEDYILVSAGTACSGTASIAGPTRSITAVYEIENGINSYAQVCQAS